MEGVFGDHGFTSRVPTETLKVDSVVVNPGLGGHRSMVHDGPCNPQLKNKLKTHSQGK